jgi:hypothetical protein
MFLKQEIIIKAFKGLHTLAESHSGKKAGERTSGIRYFLAAAEILKKKQADSVRISPAEKTDRLYFVEAVGNVVRLDEDGGYTNDFYDEFERDKSYAVSSNFLTTVLKQDGAKPGRPAPLINVNNQSISLHEEYLNNLLKYGDWNSYRKSLAVWLARFDTFEGIDGNDVTKVSARIVELLRGRYGDQIASTLVKNAGELAECFSGVSKPLLEADQTDYFSVLAPLVEKKKPGTKGIGDNIVFYGAPGTGKSYSLKGFSPSIRTVFHGDYQNSDFIGSYRPLVVDEDITYSFIPGPFIKAFINALRKPAEHQYLIIEEINRAPAASVFGEAFQLLDRDATGESEYKIVVDDALKNFLDIELKGNAMWKGELFLPKNLSLYATMNSADQGVEPLDTAFKRRWKFRYLPINFTKISSSDIRRKKMIKYAGLTYDWCEFAEAINSILMKEGVDEDRLLGPYFLSNSDFEEKEGFDEVVSGKVFIYLWDDVLRHGLRQTVFGEAYKTYNKLSADYFRGNRIFSKALESKLEYSPPVEATEAA